MQKVKVEINIMPSFEKLANHLNLKKNTKEHYAQAAIDYLNELKGSEGFIYQHYSPGGTQDKAISRLYYSDENAKKIDAIRSAIEMWKQLSFINEEEFAILLYSLLEEASRSANTTGTMSSFLKSWTLRALRPLQLQLPLIIPSNNHHRVFCQNSLDLLRELEVIDILYLDPPYTRAQYAASYHLLETIARWDQPTLYGVTGKRDITPLKSAFSIKRQMLQAVEIILASSCYRHLLMSYSNDSLISHEALLQLLQYYGEVSVSMQLLKRYNSMSRNDPRTNPRTQVEERLYYLKPRIV